jgi:hypothetical protein
MRSSRWLTIDTPHGIFNHHYYNKPLRPTIGAQSTLRFDKAEILPPKEANSQKAERVTMGGKWGEKWIEWRRD